MKCTFSAIIPTRNEQDNIRLLSEHIQMFNEVIFVDGNSADETTRTISQLYQSAVLIPQLHFKGKGSAIIMGLLRAKSEYAVILDADAPISAKEVKQLMDYLERNPECDLLKTSRHLPPGGSEDLTLIRLFGAKFFAKLTRILFKVDWTEMCYGFWAIRVDRLSDLGIEKILSNQGSVFPFGDIPYGHSFELDQLIFIKALRAKFVINEIPSFEIARNQGKSSLFAPRDGLRTLLVILWEYFKK